MRRFLGTPMPLIIVWLLLISCGLAQAEETAVDELFEPETASDYDQALLRFNNNIKSYPSFEAFKTEVLNKLPTGSPGTCFELTGGAWNPLTITKVKFEGLPGQGWQKTSGRGWRLTGKDRKFIEYRVNLKASLLSRIEGVKPRFFFGGTKRICEFQL
ncbi:hypothetical protein [Candidatus Entotheonella palauensis]|uniref:hypothetical protein n=1 Tax=Candidatus Entotheonella palauensis TaxID=93172 RepID=UPI000B7D505E|nr:hypothetical protein [Candidatus Entotheonella palauensis]